ncbi:VWA domain-containing protein [Lapillicoccus jejuensis]|uniref:Ca-activated chloride channel family protein n=1 Tax=Lapillicoccus jejuensis TaxID=402171 RepID=A0A542E012_9MICO|nr:VWA domain-containing protein [Lapillicoccus jejuensis]TQJ08524.1 Ca-activated chloride channel family protein [Lapillicoccus jejuensis]
MPALPWMLVTLLAVPLLLAAYVWQLRRRRRRTVRWSDVALVRTAVGGPSRRWRRHLPVAAVLAALALLGVGAARPQVQAQVPVSSSAVILALDVSGSMCATDVSPNRLAAAQAAVRTFVGRQDDRTKIGLVLFSGFASLVVPPTTDRDSLLAAVDGASTGRGTTIGAAILTSVDAISELDAAVAPSDREAAPAPDGSSLAPTDPPSRGPGSAPGAPSGGRAATAPEIVVLLTDGANTRGVTPADAAAQAAARGVRVYPIGFGTTHPTSLVCTARQAGVGGAFGGYPGGGAGGQLGGRGGRDVGPAGRSFLVVDEPTLQDVARTTGGEYFAAADAEELTRVLTDLPRHVQVQTREVDLSAGVAAAGAALLVLGLWLARRQGPLG